AINMIIYYLGLTTFLIKTSTGKQILIDPLNLDNLSNDFLSNIDIITISDPNYNKISQIQECTNSLILINNNLENDFCKITYFESFHDELQGVKRGPNNIFKIEVDNFSLCHLGNIGHQLSSEYINKLGSIDILFAPVGENYTLNLKAIRKLIKAIAPKMIIPMQYKVQDSLLTLRGVDKFLILHKKLPKRNLAYLQLSEPFSNRDQEILLLDIKTTVFKN
ncbi:MAG: MBL fold metallo-hydrolase, partial [Sarcina sp.]